MWKSRKREGSLIKRKRNREIEYSNFSKKKIRRGGWKKAKKRGHDVELKYENKVNSKVKDIHKNISCVTD